MKRDPFEEFASPLIKRPEYLQAIGQVTVEINFMEVMLSAVFGAAIGTTAEIARAVYYAPKAASARVDILIAGAEAGLSPRPRLLNRVIANAVRAKGILEERNAVMHDQWSIPLGADIVHRHPKGLLEQRKPVELSELESLLMRVRQNVAMSVVLLARITLDKGDVISWPNTIDELRQWLRDNPLRQNREDDKAPDIPPRSFPE